MERLALDRALVRAGDQWSHSEGRARSSQTGKSELLIARILAGLLWGWERLVLPPPQIDPSHASVRTLCELATPPPRRSETDSEPPMG